MADAGPVVSEALPSRVAIIVNPRAGHGAALRRLPGLTEASRAAGVAATIVVTRTPGEATSLAAGFAADGVPAVIAVGGDGTVNEVANGLIGAATRLIVIAAGRGRDFVRGLEAEQPARPLADLLTDAGRLIDVGVATFAEGGSRSFVNVAGVGFDAAVARLASRSRWPGNHLPYLAGLGGAISGWHNPRMTIIPDHDSEPVIGPVRLVTVANGPYFGGGLPIVPGARFDDGQLDLAIVGDISHAELLRMLPSLYRGAHTGHRLFQRRRVTTVRVEAETPVPVQLDGEISGTTPVTFTLQPAALRVTV